MITTSKRDLSGNEIGQGRHTHTPTKTKKINADLVAQDQLMSQILNLLYGNAVRAMNY